MASSTEGYGGGSPGLPLEHALEIGGVLTGMELIYVSALQDDTMTISRTLSASESPTWSTLSQGSVFAAGDTFCHRMLTGAPRHTVNAETDPAYQAAPLRTLAGLTSYLGVPLRDASGRALGTFCAVDRSSVGLSDRVQDAFASLAPGVARVLFPEPTPVTVRRGATGWVVTGGSEGTEDAEDLTSAMVLADLISAELTGPSGRPPRADASGDEVARLRVSVAQLEHALAARVVVEQAIGVLAERRSATPRVAFETLRGVARGSGRRVHALAADVVASASGSVSGLAPTLARPTVAPSPAAVAGLLRSKAPSTT